MTTGYVNGVITFDLAESDDAHRERFRRAWRSRTGPCSATSGTRSATTTGELLVLTADRHEEFRESSATRPGPIADPVDRHYAGGPPRLAGRYISAYAAMHPLEDFAETFAHFLHICDTLETARVRVAAGSGGGRPRFAEVWPRTGCR